RWRHRSLTVAVLKESSRGDRDPESLRRATNLFVADLEDVLMPPTQTSVIQAPDRAFQRYGNDNICRPRGVRYTADYAGSLIQAQPRGAFGQHEPRLLNVPEARRSLAVHRAETQVAQRADRGELAAILDADLCRLGRLAMQKGSRRSGEVRRSAPLSF